MKGKEDWIPFFTSGRSERRGWGSSRQTIMHVKMSSQICVLFKKFIFLPSKGHVSQICMPIKIMYMCVHAQLCPTLCHPMDYSVHPPGSSVRGISQTRILEWVAISSSRDAGVSLVLAGRFFTTEPPGKPKNLYTFYQKVISVTDVSSNETVYFCYKHFLFVG